MEAFEQFVALALQAEDLVVMGPMKFPVKRKTKKKARDEHQEHGYEVDLVGARGDKLILATVKSFFGSYGVQLKEVSGKGGKVGGYRLLNDPALRREIVSQAMSRFGYREDHVFLRLYVGKFAGGKRRSQEAPIREWCAKQHVGGGPIEVFGVQEVIERARRQAQKGTYTDNAVIVAMKALSAAGVWNLDVPIPPSP